LFMNEVLVNAPRTKWSIPWPPHSPDVTFPDFFLWGYVKDIVYRT
jgi:hypothetical protein